ncbi:MAG: matrixin family metalloprotease [Methylotenera sp.]|nr:matrixin family metalloprotease [Oligoflexia bacterium]
MNFKTITSPFLIVMTAMFGMTACDGSSAGAAGSAANYSPLAAGCHSDDPSQKCLALNYVTYTNSKGDAVTDQAAATRNLATINQIWKSCGIQFQIDNYQAVDPTKFGLSKVDSMNELDQIRKAFNDGNTLLIAQTGYWGTAKNAWTAMPGSGPYGAVFESTVADFGNIVAHELGHYLNLDHVNSNSDVMSAIIYPDSNKLTPDQCQEARAAVDSFWKNMQR